VRIKPATKKHTGINPAICEEITIAAKPASVDVRARPVAKAEAALPSVKKALALMRLDGSVWRTSLCYVSSTLGRPSRTKSGSNGRSASMTSGLRRRTGTRPVTGSRAEAGELNLTDCGRARGRRRLRQKG
jgi:hypothetical protein